VWRRLVGNRIMIMAFLALSVLMVPWCVYHGILTLTGNDQYRVLNALGLFVLAVYGVDGARMLWHRLRGSYRWSNTGGDP
jgi:hypothetical protein